jgi:hypothetical protein
MGFRQIYDGLRTSWVTLIYDENVSTLRCLICDAQYTTGFRAFAESEHPLGEESIPLTEGITEAKASRRNCGSEGVFAESMRGPSWRTCAERPT